MKVLVAFDESLDGRAAIRYGMQKVSKSGGELIILQVFPKRLSIDYGDGSKAEYSAPKAPWERVEGALRPVRDTDRSIWSRLVMVQGCIEEQLVQYAREKEVDLVVAPRRFSCLLNRIGCLMDVVSAEERAGAKPPKADPAEEALAEATSEKETR